MSDQTRCSILDLSAKEAKKFLLKDTSYCNFNLPSYIVFGEALSGADRLLNKKKLSDHWKLDPKECSGVNHIIYSNKDGRYAWRPFQLIHPALYVSLVNEITSAKHWKTIQQCFKKFYANKKMKCLSLPVKSLSKEKDKAEQISQWWQEVEQESIALSLDYEYLIHADITDCYSSIYTHSIAWAIHTKEVAKKQQKSKDLIGNIIDVHLRQMSYGQTNGIPQGSTLMDLIAEILLGHADVLLTEELKKLKIRDYYILRYRDDYRIFVQNSQDGESVIKALTEVLLSLGLKLNSAKTKASTWVVRDSIKSDKLSWITRKQVDKNILKHLLLIHDHSHTYPNSGTLSVALSEFHKRIINFRKIDGLRQLIAVTVDLAYHNPRLHPVMAAVLSKLLSLAPEKTRDDYIHKILKRFEKIPNTGYMEIWLQRIYLHPKHKVTFREALCKLVNGNSVEIWNSDWISSKKLKSVINSEKIIDRKAMQELAPVMPAQEIELFISKTFQY